MPGEFTNKFDKEILKAHWSDLEAEREKAAKERIDLERIEAFLIEVKAILDHRARFLVERFSNARLDRNHGYVGWRFEFRATGDGLREAAFQIRARPNDSRLAVLIESEIAIEGGDPAPDGSAPFLEPIYQKDYVSLPTHHLETARARRFIEDKILDFARLYVGRAEPGPTTSPGSAGGRGDGRVPSRKDILRPAPEHEDRAAGTAGTSGPAGPTAGPPASGPGPAASGPPTG